MLEEDFYNVEGSSVAAIWHRLRAHPRGLHAEHNDTGCLHRTRQNHGAEGGFTLLEVLVVIAILGLLIGLVAPAALRQLGSARGSVARQSIERLSSVLDLYKLDVGSYPSTDQGLSALSERPGEAANWSGPYLKTQGPVLDPWNHAYVYRNPSSRAGRDYDLCSLGPSGNATGDGMICNP